jgi:hypothetical protein
MGSSKYIFFSRVLKVALEIMLYQKIATLFALMAFAPQRVIGRPQGSQTHDIPDQIAGDLGALGAILVPPGVIAAGIQGAGGAPAA